MFNKADLRTISSLPVGNCCTALFWFQHDVKTRCTFLKRTKYDGLHLEDLFIGNKVNVFSRQLVLIDYGDQYTARQLGSRKEK